MIGKMAIATALRVFNIESFHLATARCVKLWSLNSSFFFNPLNPGAFCKKRDFWTFWRFFGWISAKLASIWPKLRLRHDSSPLLPLASRFMTFWLGHASLGFSIFDFFFFAFPFSPFLFFSLR